MRGKHESRKGLMADKGHSMDLNAFTTPINPARKPLNHLFQPAEGYTDDIVVLNTQVSTQYDGLRHL